MSECLFYIYVIELMCLFVCVRESAMLMCVFFSVFVVIIYLDSAWTQYTQKCDCYQRETETYTHTEGERESERERERERERDHMNKSTTYFSLPAL